jgi:hypothetical protein
LGSRQGDQIGRIFAYWASDCFGLLFENDIICPNFCVTLSHGIFYYFYKKGLGYFLGKFFTNSSGNPGSFFNNFDKSFYDVAKRRCHDRNKSEFKQLASLLPNGGSNFVDTGANKSCVYKTLKINFASNCKSNTNHT